MYGFKSQVFLTLKWVARDRLFYSVLGVGVVLLLLVPLLSGFSMRQVQELSITLALSCNSLFLLVMAVLLGTSSLWREIDRRYSHAVLTLPVSRTAFFLGKFCGIALFLFICALALGLFAAILIFIASTTYPSDLPIHWVNIGLAMFGDFLKSVLVAAIAMLFASVGTSFYLPFFATASIYLAGSGTQEVVEYVSGKYGEDLSPMAHVCIKGIYYLLPNFAAFNFKVQATYGLPVPLAGLLMMFGYFAAYGGIVLILAAMLFSRRQFS